MARDEVVRSIEVDLGQQQAFRLWHERIELWWPESHRISGSAEARMSLEPHVGGRLLERTTDGREIPWGVVRVWDPPRRISHTFFPAADPDAPSIVEVRFEPLGPRRTGVYVRHRRGDLRAERWEGALARFESGWGRVLAAFEGHVRADRVPTPTQRDQEGPT